MHSVYHRVFPKAVAEAFERNVNMQLEGGLLYRENSDHFELLSPGRPVSGACLNLGGRAGATADGHCHDADVHRHAENSYARHSDGY
jgi:hypothetical protein